MLRCHLPVYDFFESLVSLFIHLIWLLWDVLLPTAVSFTFSSGKTSFCVFQELKEAWRDAKSLQQWAVLFIWMWAIWWRFCCAAVFIKLFCSSVDNTVLKWTLFNVFTCSWYHCARLISEHLSFQHYKMIVCVTPCSLLMHLRYSAQICISYPLKSQFSAASFDLNLTRYVI